MLNINNLSYWEKKSFFDKLDYLIIGSGIVGYSTALHLKKVNPNAKILILERGFLPSGASSKNAGFACFGSPTELADDIERMGEAKVWETVSLRIKGLNTLKSMLGAETIDLQINGSWDLFTNNERTRFEAVKSQLPYFNQKLEEITGEPNVYSTDMNVASRFDFDNIYGSFYNKLEGQIDTAMLNKAFYERSIAAGINILFGIEALSIDKNTVTTTIGDITAKQIAICTNGFAKQFLPKEDIAPARAQVLITKPIENLKIKGTFHYQEGYYYFRNIDSRLLFGGGRNLDKEGETTTEIANTDKIMNALQELLDNVILPNTPYEIDSTWAGIMGVGKDKKPIIKQLNATTFCGVRLGGMGVAIGTLVGTEVAELMLNSAPK